MQLALNKSRQALKPGTVLVKPGVVLPRSANPGVQPGMDWDVLLGTDARGMEAAARNDGWHFFYVVPEVVVRSASVRRDRAITGALRRMIAAVEAEGVNALEITRIEISRALGVSFVKIAAQPRHIRPDPFASDLPPHRWADWEPESESPSVPSAGLAFSRAA